LTYLLKNIINLKYIITVDLKKINQTEKINNNNDDNSKKETKKLRLVFPGVFTRARMYTGYKPPTL